MSYTDLSFWLFLAALLVGVSWLPGRWRGLWLGLGSLWFYAAPDALRLVWLAGIAALALPVARSDRMAPRAVAIAALVLVLAWARFAELVGLPDPGAPPGLSFIVFTAIALIVDAHRRARDNAHAYTHERAWRWRDMALHLLWFPKLLAGPIERAGDLIPQLRGIALRPGLALVGLAFVLTGLVKKVVIADSLAPMVEAGFAHPALAAPVDLIMAAYAFAFQIYCDFSGYSDIAIGLSALVGLRLTRNFDRPYLSATVAEFWSSRWHISLGHWFRDFVYIPLGGSRHGRARQVLNLMALFLLSGLWHAGLGYGVGWGFIVWGALNGVFVAVETVLPAPVRRFPRLLRGIVTFHLILVTWVFFRAASLTDATTLLRRIAQSVPEWPTLIPSYPLTADHRFAFALIALLLLAEAASGPRALAERLAAWPLPLRWAGLYAGIALLLLAGRWQETGFIYAGF